MSTQVSADAAFEDWIDELNERVIQEEFGYEAGEFSVFPEHWWSLFDEGLSPRQAWQRALDQLGETRREDDARRADEWDRMQASDAALSLATKKGPGHE